MIRRFFFPSMAAALTAANGLLLGDVVINPAVARGRRSSIRLKNRSRYQPHKGGGQRTWPHFRTEGDYRRIERAEAKRQRKGIF